MPPFFSHHPHKVCRSCSVFPHAVLVALDPLLGNAPADQRAGRTDRASHSRGWPWVVSSPTPGIAIGCDREARQARPSARVRQGPVRHCRSYARARCGKELLAEGWLARRIKLGRSRFRRPSLPGDSAEMALPKLRGADSQPSPFRAGAGLVLRSSEETGSEGC